MTRRLRRERLRDDRGATAVEFAIVFPVLVMVVFFVFYGAMFFYYSAVASHVARVVARQDSIPTSAAGTTYPDSSSTWVATYAKQQSGGLIPAPTSATTTSQGSQQSPAEGDLVKVTITYKLPVLDQLASVVPGMSSIDTISQSATERRQ